MTPDQLIAVITAAKANGVSWLKTAELEIRLGQEHTSAVSPASTVPSVQASLGDALPIAINGKAEAQITPEEEQEIKHTVEHLKSVMAMDDDELINRLFPEPKEETEAAS